MITGRIIKDIYLSILVLANKILNIQDKIDLSGNIIFIDDNNIYIYGNKIFNIKESITIKSNKIIDFKESKKIIGKKDLTNILIALDLMED